MHSWVDVFETQQTTRTYINPCDYQVNEHYNMAPNRPSTFDVRELTISRFHEALRSGQTTCTEVTAAYLSRISTYNPILKALVTINPHALDIACQKDSKPPRYSAAKENSHPSTASPSSSKTPTAQPTCPPPPAASPSKPSPQPPTPSWYANSAPRAPSSSPKPTCTNSPCRGSPSPL